MARRYLDFEAARLYLGDMPATRLRRLIETRKVPHHKAGRVFFYSDELDRWVKDTQRGVTPKTVIVLPQPSQQLGDLRGLIPSDSPL